MKKIAMTIIALVLTVTASAQFEKGKFYTGASISGLGLNYSGEKGLSIGLGAKGGYCIVDNWMAVAHAGINTQTEDTKNNTSAEIGIGARYYIIQNGIYLGVNGKYKHYFSTEAQIHNDLMPGVEVGYAFFVNRYCTIEPSIYYDQSFNNHGKYSQVGIKVGIGIYM